MVEVPDSTTRYIQNDSGKPTKDLFNWMRNTSAQLASIFSGTVGGLFSTGLPCFSAHRNAVNQNGFPYQVATQLQINVEAYDIGGFYNTTSYRWIPPTGRVFMTAASFSSPDGGGTPLGCIIYIYKNGGLFKQSAGSFSFGVNGGTITIEDVANGTDYYEVWKIDNQSIAAGTSTVNGLASATYFMGHWVSP